MRKDGSRFWAHVILQPVFDEHKKHVGYAKITTDRTEQKRINELNAFLMNEVADFAIFLLDKAGNVAKWSKAAEKIIGYTEQEVIGKSLSILYPDTHESNIREAVETHLSEARNAKHEEENWRVRKDGSFFWANYVITPLHNQDGYVVMIRDLTEKRAYEQTSKANIALTASNKQLERFAHIASHDLKEPVRKISIYSHLLKAETPKQEKLIDKIIHASRRMVNLIDDILDFSSISKRQPFQKQDLKSILHNVLDSLEVVIKEKGAIVRHTPLPSALVIPSQMEQLFQNLITNALKFCCLNDQTPHINIEGAIVPKEHLGAARLNHMRHSDHYLQIKVQDNGIGFEQKYATKIFDLFKRLHGKPEFEGTGIGLSICKKVVENHGGYITAISEKGKGALFIVTLP
jgi:PAS domain S-box-containing protein